MMYLCLAQDIRWHQIDFLITQTYKSSALVNIFGHLIQPIYTPFSTLIQKASSKVEYLKYLE